MKTNFTSPYEAIITPITIRETLPSFLREGGSMPKAQVAKRVATTFVACGGV